MTRLLGELPPGTTVKLWGQWSKERAITLKIMGQGDQITACQLVDGEDLVSAFCSYHRIARMFLRGCYYFPFALPCELVQTPPQAELNFA